MLHRLKCKKQEQKNVKSDNTEIKVTATPIEVFLDLPAQ